MKVGDYVKAPGLFQYFLIVEEEDLGYWFPKKFYAINVFTGGTAVVHTNWKVVGKFNPIRIILSLGCIGLLLWRYKWNF